MVSRRLAPLVVALAIAFAPIALDACQATCALHAVAAVSAAAAHHHQAAPAAQADDSGHGHSCHHLATPRPATGGTEVRGLPHQCAHVDDLPAAATIALHANLAAPAVVATVVFDAPPARDAERRIDGTPDTSPPRIANITQLRV